MKVFHMEADGQGGIGMSLTVYRHRGNIPEGMTVIDRNDRFFNGYTNLDNSKFCVDVLRETDKATVLSENVFLSRAPELGGLNKNCLSM